MLYAKPHMSLLDARCESASCTPCSPKYDTVYVSWEYSQVGKFGFCNTIDDGGLFSFQFRSGNLESSIESY